MKKFEIEIPSLNHRKIFWILALFLGILMPILSFDYGITEDDPAHSWHGEILQNYFTGKDTLALAKQGVDWGKSTQWNNPWVNLYSDQNNALGLLNSFYGGFFDLLTAFLHHFFYFIGKYEFRNIIKSLFGFLLFLFTGLLAKELGGWKTGLLALVFIVLTPTLFGLSMTNTRDISCAAFYIFSLFYIIKLIKELPEIKLKRIILLVINISILINIRPFGILMIAFLFIAVFGWWIFENYKNHFKNIDYKKSCILALKILGIGFAAYFATCIFWPYAQTNPLKIPLYVALKSNNTGFQTYQLFEGKFMNISEIPWYYIPECLLIITIPLHILFGIYFIILFYLKKIMGFYSSANLFLISFIIITSLFPIFYAVATKSPAYDFGRVFLFTLPPLICLSALSWENLFNNIGGGKLNIYHISFLEYCFFNLSGG